MNCEGCIYRYWVEAAFFSMTTSGWGCLNSGGHAMKRCSQYKEANYGKGEDSSRGSDCYTEQTK